MQSLWERIAEQTVALVAGFADLAAGFAADPVELAADFAADPADDTRTVHDADDTSSLRS